MLHDGLTLLLFDANVRNYKLPFKDLPFGEDMRKYLATPLPAEEGAEA